MNIPKGTGDYAVNLTIGQMHAFLEDDGSHFERKVMTWTTWQERIGSKIVDRAFSIIAKQGKADTYTLADVESAIHSARLQLSAENGIHPYENVLP